MGSIKQTDSVLLVPPLHNSPDGAMRGGRNREWDERESRRGRVNRQRTVEQRRKWSPFRLTVGHRALLVHNCTHKDTVTYCTYRHSHKHK